MVKITNIWVAADHHLGHKNVLRFTDDNGELIRGKVFKDIIEHDNLIIEWHNELVKPEDHVYFLGDVCISARGLDWIKRFNGHKRLVRGNHDIFKTKKYVEAGFDEIYGVRVFQNHEPPYIFSHIPIHPKSLRGNEKKQWINVHGHLHNSIVLDENKHPDKRYMCVSLEQTNYKPVLLIK